MYLCYNEEMVYVGSRETVARGDFVASSIDVYSKVLKQETEDNYPHTPPEVIKSHQGILASLVIPNLRHGTFEIPRDAPESYIPILALPSNGSVVVPPEVGFSLHPQQIESGLSHLRTYGMKAANNGLLNDMVQYLARYDGFSGSTVSILEYSALSHVDMGAFHFPELRDSDQRRVMYGRPLVILGTEECAPRHYIPPYVLGHELEHVAQNLNNPLRRYSTMGNFEDARLRDELLAYAVEESIITATVTHRNTLELPSDEEADAELLLFVGSINAVRRHINQNRKDPFFPSHRLRNALSRLGLSLSYPLPHKATRQAPFYDTWWQED